MSMVVDDLIAADDSELLVMSMLHGEDLRGALVDEAAQSNADPTGFDQNVLTGPFAHIVVDEAQELTDAEWQMLLLRCPSRSFTIVGDRAQARHGFGGAEQRSGTEPWQERLERIGLDRVKPATLSINYRTPEEVMAEAEPVIRGGAPGRQRADLRPPQRPPTSSTELLRIWARSSTVGSPRMPTGLRASSALVTSKMARSDRCPASGR